MILFDLRCARGHVFEAWFRSNATYDAQRKAGDVGCPNCGSRKVERAPMAPRIGKSGDGSAQSGREAKEMGRVLKQLREIRSKIEANCDYVGARFAEEARRIHHGEIEKRSIYGEASDREATALRDEGIEFARIPWVPRHDS